MDISEAVGSAGIASDVLAQERDDLLRAGTWNFAVTRAQLAPLAATPVFGFQYAFAIPADCSRIISVQDNQWSDGSTGTTQYKIESIQQADMSYVEAILSKAQTLWIRYVRDVTDVNAMATSFRQVLILRLAKIFAISVAKSNALYQAIDKELDAAMRSARSIDGIEDYPEKLQEGSWANSRRRWARTDLQWTGSGEG